MSQDSSKYPEALSHIVPYLVRFGRADPAEIIHLIHSEACGEDLRALDKLSAQLFADDAALLHLALDYCGELSRQGRKLEEGTLRTFLRVLSPLPFEPER